MSDEKFKWTDSQSYKINPFQAFWDHEFNHKETNSKRSNTQSFRTAWDHQQEKIDHLEHELKMARAGGTRIREENEILKKESDYFSDENLSIANRFAEYKTKAIENVDDLLTLYEKEKIKLNEANKVIDFIIKESGTSASYNKKAREYQEKYKSSN